MALQTERKLSPDHSNPANPANPTRRSSKTSQRVNGLASHEAWILKIVDPKQQRALELNFSTLVSQNGFRRLAEVSALYFERGANKEITKFAVKQSDDLRKIVRAADQSFTVGENGLTPTSTSGNIQAKGHEISWDLQFQSAQEAAFVAIPEAFSKTGLLDQSTVTLQEDLRFTGTTRVDGRTMNWGGAVGMRARISRPSNPHSVVWGQCNSFTDERGSFAPFIFEGISLRTRLIGPVPSPKLSSYYFFYRGKNYYFNTAWSSLRLQSRNNLNEWTFQADRGYLSFRGRAQAEHRDFIGVMVEDTTGSLLYNSTSLLADMEIHVYRRGKLESTFRANGTAAFEISNRLKNPYVPLLI